MSKIFKIAEKIKLKHSLGTDHFPIDPNSPKYDYGFKPGDLVRSKITGKKYIWLNVASWVSLKSSLVHPVDEKVSKLTNQILLSSELELLKRKEDVKENDFKYTPEEEEEIRKIRRRRLKGLE